MKINILLSSLFLSVVIYASIESSHGFVGTTQLNGDGCACHSLTPSASVNVWIEGPDTVAQGETVLYKIFLKGGPSVLGGFNVASRFGDVSPVDTLVREIDNELTHNSPLIFSSVNDTISWNFNYTALNEGWDTLYSVGNSVDGNNIPTNDEWNFGEKFPVFVTPPVPVELISFSAKSSKEGIQLNWTTATELNNNGFEIERLQDYKFAGLQNWNKIGFVEGKGTTTEQHSYSFFDSPKKSGTYFYRLRQIDFDGTSSHSEIISSDFNPEVFSLSQNYPNPFNPETNISFIIPDEGHLNLKIYSIQGELVDILSDGLISAGNHLIKWNALKFTSGVYFCKIEFKSNTGLELSDVKKMILAK